MRWGVNKMPEYPAIISNKIKYDSPSGFVNVGKYIPPFEKVKKGFGYKGALYKYFKGGVKEWRKAVEMTK